MMLTVFVLLCSLLKEFGCNAVSASIDFPSNSNWDAHFNHRAYEYSLADCDSLCNHLRDVPWEDIFKLSLPAVSTQFSERGQVVIDVYL